MKDFWNEYYKSLEGASIIKFEGMFEDVYNSYDAGFPSFLVRFADGSTSSILISRDPEGNGGGFIVGLPTD